MHPTFSAPGPSPSPRKQRSKLQQAVRLLPQHIKSLPKRVAYMKRLVESEGLPAGERLELAARLLLDMRSGGGVGREEGGTDRVSGLAKAAFCRWKCNAGPFIHSSSFIIQSFIQM